MSFGEELRRERELRKISLREVAEATKINLRYLDALERNDFKHLPGGVFNKGFVRAYAQYIGVDPDAMVNAYLLEEQAQNPTDESGSPEPAELLRGTARSAPSVSGSSETGKPAPPRAMIWAGALLLLLLALSAAGWFVARWWSAGPPASSYGTHGQTILPNRDDSGSAEPASPPSKEPPEPAVKEPEEQEEREGATGRSESQVASDVPPAAPSLESRTARAADAAAGPAASEDSFEVLLLRPTAGRVNCDNRRIEVLSGLPAGSRFTFRCRRFLRVEAEDGGAVQVSAPGQPPVPAGESGVPVEGRVYRPGGRP